MHGHADVRASMSRPLIGVVVALAVATGVGALLLRPRGDFVPGVERVGIVGPVYDSVVTDVDREPCTEGEVGAGIVEPVCVRAMLRLLEGPDRGRRVPLRLPDSPTTPSLIVDDKVVLAYQADAEPEFRYTFVDRQRKPVLFWLALLFAGAVVLLGRLRGVAALGGLAVSLVVLLTFVIPGILDGRPPILVAIVGAAAISFVALYLAHGLNAMTTVALLGTLGSLALTAALANAFVGLAKLSGFTSDESILIRLVAAPIEGSGLVLAGIIIGALGALDDVTVTQASAVWELRAADPQMPARRLYRSGLRIGRDHIASTVNTLLLAYAGASLPLLLFFVVSEQSLGTVANQEVVATEIIRTLVGSLGLVASVPLTTWLAARVARPPAP